MESYSDILAKIVFKPEPKIVIPRCQPNTHHLGSIGGSYIGEPGNEYAPVYMCLICKQMGYKEDFSK
jgi:hypothetical protein